MSLSDLMSLRNGRIKNIRRNDLCYLVGRRAGLLSGKAAIKAWRELAQRLEDLGERDLPKFQDIVMSIRHATIEGRKP